MINLFKLTSLLTAFFCLTLPLFSVASESDEKISDCCADYPFQLGEKLNFNLYWSLVQVGKVEMEVSGPEIQDGQPCLHFRLSVKTNSAIDAVYKVRTDIHGWADSEMNRTMHYTKKQKEGKTNRDIVVDYDWPKNQLVYSNWGKEQEPLSLKEVAFDPVTAIYHFRRQKMVVGKVYEFPVTDGKKLVMGKVTVLARETIKTSFGMIDTFKVEPELQHVGGVFKKSDNASMYIWLSADRYKIPVKLKSEVKVGSFHAEIKKIKLPGIEGIPDDFSLVNEVKEIKRSHHMR